MNRFLKLFLTGVFLLHAIVAVCQGDRKFIGRLLYLDGGKKPVINMSVRLVNEGSGTTGTDGKFEIAINGNSGAVTLELVNSDRAIIYPAGGVAKVPKDPNELIEFYIGDSPKDILTKALAKSNNDLKNSLSQLGIKQDGIEESLAAFRDEIQKMSAIKIADLQNQMDLASKRDIFYPVISSAINNYINEAKDVKDAFKFTARNAFEDPQALQLLTDAINSYNQAYEDLNRKHSGYERTVNDLWQSESKTLEVTELFNYALGEIHSANIFTLNLKVRDINDYFRGDVKGSKKAFKDNIIREIETATLQLERRLDELDNQAHIVLNKLAT
jgi:hypothetical protein